MASTERCTRPGRYMSSPASPPVLDLTADPAEVIDLTADTASASAEVIDLTDGFPDGNIACSFWQDVYDRLVASTATNIVDLTAAEEE